MLLVLGVAIATLAVGCGGGGDGEATAAQMLTWPQFVKKANAICRAQKKGLSKEVAAWFTHDRKNHFPEESLNWRVAHYVLLPAIEDQVVRIYALKPPAGDRPGIEASLGSEEVAMAKIQSSGKLASMKAFHRYFAESATELRANELDDCANDH
jgi:hypothetical protein